MESLDLESVERGNQSLLTLQETPGPQTSSMDSGRDSPGGNSFNSAEEELVQRMSGLVSPNVAPPSSKLSGADLTESLADSATSQGGDDQAQFFFTLAELAPELSAAAHDKFSHLPMSRPKTQSALLREQRRKEMRARAKEISNQVKHKRVHIPENLRFAPDVISYKVGPPAKGSGSFYVKPFTLAPPRRITRTQRQWAESGLLPNVKGGKRTEKTKALEAAKGARDVLNRTPLIVPQGILREARSYSVYKTIGETSKERFLPGEAVMLAKMKGGLIDYGPDYYSGTVTLEAPTWDVPIKPQFVSKPRSLLRARAQSYQARFYKTGELPTNRYAAMSTSASQSDLPKPSRTTVVMPPRRSATGRHVASSSGQTTGTGAQTHRKPVVSEVLVLDDGVVEAGAIAASGGKRAEVPTLAPLLAETSVSSATKDISSSSSSSSSSIDHEGSGSGLQAYLPQPFVDTPLGHRGDGTRAMTDVAPSAGAMNGGRGGRTTSAPQSFLESGGSALFASSLSEAADVHLETHEWHETLARRGDIKSETHPDVMRALRSYTNSVVPNFVPLHMRAEYTANPARELMHTPGTPQYRRHQAELANRHDRLSPKRRLSPTQQQEGDVEHGTAGDQRIIDGGSGSDAAAWRDFVMATGGTSSVLEESSSTTPKTAAAAAAVGEDQDASLSTKAQPPLVMDPTKPGSAGGWRVSRGQPIPPMTPPSSLAAASQSPSDGGRRHGGPDRGPGDDFKIVEASPAMPGAALVTEPSQQTTPAKGACSGGNLGSGSTTEVRQDRGGESRRIRTPNATIPAGNELADIPDLSEGSTAPRRALARANGLEWELPKGVLSKRDKARESSRGVTPLIAGRRDYNSDQLVRKLLPGEELLHVTSRTDDPSLKSEEDSIDPSIHLIEEIGLFPAFKASDEAEKFERLKAQAHNAAASVASGGSSHVKLPGRVRSVFTPKKKSATEQFSIEIDDWSSLGADDFLSKIDDKNPVGFHRRNATYHPQLTATHMAVQTGIDASKLAQMTRPERAAYLRHAGHERRGHVHKPIPITEGFKRELIKFMYARAVREVGGSTDSAGTSEVSSLASNG